MRTDTRSGAHSKRRRCSESGWNCAVPGPARCHRRHHPTRRPTPHATTAATPFHHLSSRPPPLFFAAPLLSFVPPPPPGPPARYCPQSPAAFWRHQNTELDLPLLRPLLDDKLHAYAHEPAWAADPNGLLTYGLGELRTDAQVASHHRHR